MKARSLLSFVRRISEELEGNNDFIPVFKLVKDRLSWEPEELSKVMGNTEGFRGVLDGLKTEGAEEDVGALTVHKDDAEELLNRLEKLPKGVGREVVRHKLVGKEISPSLIAQHLASAPTSDGIHY